MSQAYSDPTRADDPHALPNVETFYMDVREFVEADVDTWMHQRTIELDPSPFSNLTDCSSLEGWYWWACFPGCMPDGPPMGPFDTYDLAREDSLTDPLNSGYKP